MIRRWLHDHGHHRWCRVARVRKRVEVGRDYGPYFLEYTDPATGLRTKIDATVFGGQPIYEDRTVEVHQ